jgi:SAM-dependent methyltransferase
MSGDAHHAVDRTNAELWERHAGWWQEHFTDGADPEYEEQILPLVERYTAGAARVCEVGCGEGQVARRIASAGASLVVGIDGSVAQVAEAAARAGGPVYARADASRLPLPDGTMDAVVVCLVFEHLDDIASPIAEISRVLAPGGRFVLLLNHPLLQTPGSGWVDDHMVDPPEQYWQLGNYLEPTAVVEEVSKGVFIRFVHRPLGTYLNGLTDAGLVFERMEEPPPPPGFLAAAPEYPLASHIPRLLALVLRKP